MSTISTHRGLPDGMNRYDLARLVQETRRVMQMSKTAANVLVHDITCCTFDQDYEPGRICAAWPRVSTVAERLDLCDRSVNGAERELVALGFIERTTGRNGARHGERSTDKLQKIKWAAGVNLAPLIARVSELVAAQTWMRREQGALKSLKAEIKHLSRKIRESSDVEALTAVEDIVPCGRTSRIKNAEHLRHILDQLVKVDAVLQGGAGAPKISDASEQNCAPNTKENLNSNLSTGQLAKTHAVLTPPDVMEIAGPNFKDHAEMYGCDTWPALVEVASHVATYHGLTDREWGHGCHILGRERAAICMAVVDRNAALPMGHRYHARSVRRCFGGMIASSQNEALNIPSFLAALRKIPASIGGAMSCRINKRLTHRLHRRDL